MSKKSLNAGWKMWIVAGLSLLVLADGGLAVFLWQSGEQGELAMRAERDHLALTAKLLNADVRRSEKIRASIPQVGRDCTDFYEKTFPSAAVGYSSIESDLYSIAQHAGLPISGVSYKPKSLPDRGVTDLEITAQVNGDYAAIIRFINGLEVSKNFYLLNDLSLDAATTGGIRLQLKLHTYFRNA
jgi:hypothetical protein